MGRDLYLHDSVQLACRDPFALLGIHLLYHFNQLVYSLFIKYGDENDRNESYVRKRSRKARSKSVAGLILRLPDPTCSLPALSPCVSRPQSRQCADPGAQVLPGVTRITAPHHTFVLLIVRTALKSSTDSFTRLLRRSPAVSMSGISSP